MALGDRFFGGMLPRVNNLFTDHVGTRTYVQHLVENSSAMVGVHERRSDSMLRALQT